MFKKYGEPARDCTDAQLREAAGLRVRSAPRQRRGCADPTWEVHAVSGARVGRKGREYLVMWVYEIEPGEREETWEAYERLLSPGDDGELDIHPDIEKQVVELDALTPEEELRLVGLDDMIQSAENCVLVVEDRVLHDRGIDAGGYQAGRVIGHEESGSIRVQFDDERTPRTLERARLLKAPAPTSLTVGSCVRVAYESDDLPEGMMRWQYGFLTTIHQGRELVDIKFDNHEKAEHVPTYDVEAVALAYRQ